MSGALLTRVVLAVSLALNAIGLGLLLRARRTESVVRQNIAEHAALRRVATGLAGEPDGALALVADEAATLVGAEGALVAEFTGGGVRATAARDALSTYEESEFPLNGGGVLAQVAATGRPARIDDYANLPAHEPVHTGGAWSGTLGCAVAVPVFVGARVWGALMVMHSRPRSLPETTEARLSSFAELVVTAISASEARRELQRQATTDPLTGLANRRTFESRLEEECDRTARSGRPFALVLMDIDHFKTVNDTHGHTVGDQVLKVVSQRLQAQSRPGDLLARIGGEEFALVLSDADEETARAVAERARRRVSQEPIAPVGVITLSAGACDSRHADSPGALAHAADIALYWAKRSGRDRCGGYSQVGVV